MTQRHVVVIGAGLGGLSAARLLERGGARVTVLESSKQIGGRGRTGDHAGHLFNLGPHALYCGGEAMQVLRDLEVPFQGAPPPVAGVALHGERTFVLPVGPWSLLRTSLLGLRAKLAVGSFLARLGKVDAAALAGVSTQAWLEREIEDAAARAVVLAVVRLASYVHSPTTFSAEVACQQLQRAIASGVLYLDGGWQTLADGLADGLESPVQIGCAARAVEHADGCLRVRLADGEALLADAVVLAVPPRVASKLCPALRLPKTTPIRAACLDVALTRTPRPRSRFLLGIDRPLYASLHSATARLAPTPEGGVVHVARYLGEDTPDVAAVERELEEVLDLLQPGWREQEVARQFLPQITVAHDLDRCDGPPVDGAAAPGVHLVGDWVGDEGWLLDRSLASARAAATRILNGAEVCVRTGA